MTNKKLDATIVPSSKIALSNAVAARVQIQSIRLIETQAKQSLVSGKLPTKIAVTVNTFLLKSADGKAIGVHATFTLKGRYDENDTGEPPLHIQASFILDYSLASTEGLTQGNYDAFAELNGVHNGWPYWREYVQSVTTRMGLPPLAIPVYRVVPATFLMPKAQPVSRTEKKSGVKQKRQIRAKKNVN